MSQALRKQATLRAVPSIPQAAPRAPAAMPSTLAAKRHAQQAEQHEVLVREFGAVASAPNGIKKLRELILDLGMRGLLSTQQSSETIAANIGADISSKKRYAAKEVSEEETPYTLPDNWLWMRLGQATSFGTTDKAGALSANTWVLDLEDIEKDTSKLLQKLRFSQRPAKSDKNLFKSGDVLYGKLRPYLNKVIVADEDGACTTEILPIRWNFAGNSKFLMYALKRPDFLSYVNSKSYGMKMPRLGTADGFNALIPVAPLKEQKRIVDKIDELMALCDLMEAQQADAEAAHKTLVKTLLDALTQSQDAFAFNASWARISENFDLLFNNEASIDNLKQTVLQLAVTGKLTIQDSRDEPANKLLSRIYTRTARQDGKQAALANAPIPSPTAVCKSNKLPNGWEEIRLGTIIELISGQHLKPEEYLERQEFDAIPYLTGPAEFGQLNPAPKRYTREKRAVALQNDILLTVKGSGVGKTNVVSQSELAISRQLMAIRPILVNNDFIHIFLNTLSDYFQNLTVGIAIPGISRVDVQDVAMQLPPIEEQRRIVAKVDELMALCDALKARLAKANTLHEQLADALVKQGAAG